MTYFLLFWFLSGFLSLLFGVLIYDREITVGNLLSCLFWGFTGLFATFMTIMVINERYKFLGKVIFKIKDSE